MSAVDLVSKKIATNTIVETDFTDMKNLTFLVFKSF